MKVINTNKDYYLRPAVSLGLVLVVGTSSLQHRFVDPSAAGNNADHGAVGGGDDLLASRGQLHSEQQI